MPKHTPKERKAKKGLLKAFPTEFQPTARELADVTQAVENYKATEKRQGRNVNSKQERTVYNRSMESIKARRKSGKGNPY